MSDSPVPDATVAAEGAFESGSEPQRGHGSIRLIEDRCTSCMICARECPTWCISIDSHSQVLPEAEGHHPSRHRVRTTNVLDAFDIDWALCMYCGICIEECPFDALEWAGPHVAGADSLAGLVHDRQRLAAPDQGPAEPEAAAGSAAGSAGGSVAGSRSGAEWESGA